MMKRTAALILALGVTGCATAPTAYDFPKTRSVQDSKDAVWERVVEFFAENNLAIKTIEKDSGIIAAERLITAPQRNGMIGSWASCGSAPMETPIQQNVDLNVFVRPQGHTTSVTVNTRFNERRQFMGESATTTECNSTGALETMILDAASRRN